MKNDVGLLSWKVIFCRKKRQILHFPGAPDVLAALACFNSAWEKFGFCDRILVGPRKGDMFEVLLFFGGWTPYQSKGCVVDVKDITIWMISIRVYI